MTLRACECVYGRTNVSSCHRCMSLYSPVTEEGWIGALCQRKQDPCIELEILGFASQRAYHNLRRGMGCVDKLTAGTSCIAVGDIWVGSGVMGILILLYVGFHLSADLNEDGRQGEWRRGEQSDLPEG